MDKLADAFTTAYESIVKGAAFREGLDPFARLSAEDLDGIIESMARSRPLTPAAVEKAKGAVSTVFDHLDAETMHTPEGAHHVEKRLKSLAFKYKASPDPDVREYGELLHDVANQWKTAWRSALPEEAAATLKDIDAAYTRFVPVRRAAATGNVTDPDAYTPKRLLLAIRAGDKTPSKTNFVAGGLPQQELAAAADKVLGNKVPDSGTTERALLGLGTAGIGTFVPHSLPPIAAMAAYGTRPVQNT